MVEVKLSNTHYCSGKRGRLTCRGTDLIIRCCTEDSREAPESLKAVLLPIITSLRFWSLCLYYAVLMLVRQVFLDWTPTFLTQVCGADETKASLGSSIFAFSGGLAALLMGYLNDRLPRTISSWAMIPFMLLLILDLVVLAIASGVPDANPYLLLFLVAAAGFFMMGPYTLAMTLTLRFGGKKSCATGAGLIDTAGSLLAVLSGSLGGSTNSDSGWERLFWILSCLAAVSTAFVVAYCVFEMQDRRRRIENLEDSAESGQVEVIEEGGTLSSSDETLGNREVP